MKKPEAPNVSHFPLKMKLHNVFFDWLIVPELYDLDSIKKKNDSEKWK